MTWTMYAVYAGVTATVGAALLLWLHRATRRAEAQRSARVEQIKRFDAIRTETPLDDPAATARERGLESIATRFALMRRILLPLACILLAVVVALPLLGGAPATVVSLVVAVAAVVTGIAAKPLLENLIAGIVISYSQPVRIGDTVLVDGHYGTIEDITITHTTIKVWDWRRYMVPNHRMIEKEFVNYSIIDRFQWAHVEFWVAPDADVDRVRQFALDAARHSPSFANHEEPRFWIMEMGKEGIRCWVAAWANTPSAAWQLTHDIRTELIRQFQAAGIRTHGYEHRWQPSLAGDQPAWSPRAVPEVWDELSASPVHPAS